jgi:hypothetical protein
LQILAIVASIGLMALGIKAIFGGLVLSKEKTLTGTPAKVVGVLCILGGLAVLPGLFLLISLLSRPHR